MEISDFSDLGDDVQPYIPREKVGGSRRAGGHTMLVENFLTGCGIYHVLHDCVLYGLGL